jgi:hypothetical protein
MEHGGSVSSPIQTNRGASVFVIALPAIIVEELSFMLTTGFENKISP